MEKSPATKIVSQTFQNPFNKDSFIYFIKSLLNHIEPAPFIYRGNFVPDAYKSYIKTLERIGKYQDKDDKKIDLLIVHLKKEKSLERARTMQRNFIAWYLNGSRGDILKDAALVAFVPPNSDDWRFSLVKMDYRLDTLEEKPKVKQELTPARRFSFLVGKTESSHTAQSCLAPILQDDVNDPTLKNLEEAFNVESVTKEFFKKYRGLFLEAKDDLDKIIAKDDKIKKDFSEKNIVSTNFAKKLLGQIVFLYFLQKKGWFGVARDSNWGTGPKDFLRQLFNENYGEYENFFNDILEPLFYEALAIERAGNFYSRFNCKIPFLNGGLFDPMKNYDWIHADIFLPNELFSNSNRTKEGDIGDGILDIFDRYNFTVKEDEPLEKEVAIDPEMLGKVFENLLEVKDRKSKGTYYTPREIVHYMCQQSLINYLATESKDKVKKEDIETLIKYGETVVEHDSRVVKQGKETKTYSFKLPKSIRDNAKLIDEKLTSIRICDPAVGSGAFPVGMMNEVIRARNALTDYLKDKKKRTIYDFKRHVIQNCLYGVDIDSGAVEIAKLRLWLSLIVDEEDIKQIKPLPNLDYKIIQGNSLIELLSSEFLAKTIDNRRSELIDKFIQTKREFFGVTSSSEKTKKREEIDNLIIELFEYDRNSIINNLKQKIRGIQNQGRLFTDAKFGEDDRKQIKEIQDRIKEFQKMRIPGPADHFEWHLNFSEVFREKNGFDVIIANPPYNAILTDAERESFKKKYESVRNGRQDTAAIFVEVAKNIGNKKMQFAYILPFRLFSRKRNHGQFQIYTLNNFSIKKVLYLGSNIGFSASDEFMILIMSSIFNPDNKIKIAFKPSLDRLDDKSIFSEINQSYLIERNEINLNLARFDEGLLSEIVNKTELLGSICHVKDGIVPFIREKLLSSKKIDNRYVRFAGIAGKYVLQKYYFSSVELYLCYDFNEAKKYIKNISELRKVQLREKNIFLHRKILTSQNSAILKGTINENKTFVSNSLHSTYLREEFRDKFSLEYILALINSNLINYYHNSLRLKGTDLHPQILIGDLKKLPIKIIPYRKQKPFINLVDKILTITENDDYLQNETKQKKVKKYEQKIDKMVYKLYGLTQEDIKIVEGTINY